MPEGRKTAITAHMKIPVSEKNSNIMPLAMQPYFVADEKTMFADAVSIYKAYSTSAKAISNA
ncbi:MAG: hypothetical protein NVSMB56_10140 [Pyrinomonadaceae bacterium]